MDSLTPQCSTIPLDSLFYWTILAYDDSGPGRERPTDTEAEMDRTSTEMEYRHAARVAAREIQYALSSLHGPVDPDDVKAAQRSLAEALAHLYEVTG